MRYLMQQRRGVAVVRDEATEFQAEDLNAVLVPLYNSIEYRQHHDMYCRMLYLEMKHAIARGEEEWREPTLSAS